MKQTQKSKVIARLRDFGEVSRNWCLDQYITRLAAIIQILKQEGWEFETREYNGDYIYKIASAPKRVIRWDLDRERNVRVPVYGI